MCRDRVAIPVHSMDLNLIVVRTKFLSKDRIHPSLGELVFNKDRKLLVDPSRDGPKRLDGELALA
jgi:hypothetical protein